ncbi:MAG TPA: NHL repeat-containing protein [Candidatus Acidoferrales bacterium]|nr:NHL repeat-containing protein [Candidatus Acidoferrales bacterium]
MATAAVPPPPPLEYAGAWGIRGTGPGQLNAPVSMTVDTAGNVYIADAGNACVSKFSGLGEQRLSFQDDRLVLHPVSIAVDGGGTMYLSDGHRGSVIIYRPDGSRLREMRLYVQADAGGTLRVAVDADGHICVAGKKPFGVRKYTWRGRTVSPWKNTAATEAAVGEPAGLAAGPDGLVYVSDAARGAIRVYQRDGTLLRTLTAPGGGVPFAGIAVNAQWIVATDPHGHALHVWTSGGAYRLGADLSPWITAADPSPQAVALTPGGECLVLDAPGARVLRFRLHL